jgi:excisionase family DNA binding protein
LASFLPLSFASVAEEDLDFKPMQEQREQEEALLKEPVQQEWISYPEAERYSGLSHTTLWRYVSNGQLKAARIGRSVRIYLPALKAFMNEKARKEAPDEPLRK